MLSTQEASRSAQNGLNGLNGLNRLNRLNRRCATPKVCGCVKAAVCSSEGLAQNRQIQVAVGLLSHEQQIDVLSKMVAGVLLWRLRHSFRGSRTAFGFFMKLHVQTQ